METELNPTTTQLQHLSQLVVVPNKGNHHHDINTNNEPSNHCCPICLDAMTVVDELHPLQCGTPHCDYNFCRTCIQSLISSSQDEYMEASDGNHHVKVFLHCPHCRSDLSSTIRDTLLLRRVDAVLLKQQEPQQQCTSDMKEGVADSVDDKDNDEDDQNMKVALQDEQVQYVVEEAREREAAFFQGKLRLDHGLKEVPSKLSTVTADSSGDDDDDDSDDDSYDSDEEWGVEADLIQGVHSSFRCPIHVPPPRTSAASTFAGGHLKEEQQQQEQRWLRIDDTLLAGLGDFMCPQRQERVTDLLTSGDPTKLAQAAMILRQVTENMNRDRGDGGSGRMSRRNGRSQRNNSVYNLIQEAQQSHEKQNGNNNKNNNTNPHSARFRHRQMELELQERADYLRSHPLPVRMPKCVEFTLHRHHNNDNFPLSFCNDVWDGTVRDAFCKLSVGFLNQVTKNETRHTGVAKILGGNGPVRIDLEKPRVLVASVMGEAGRQGVMKGDVVTHVNGEPFEGDANALKAKIADLSGDSFTLVFNASQSVAEALRMRSLVPMDY